MGGAVDNLCITSRRQGTRSSIAFIRIPMGLANRTRYKKASGHGTMERKKVGPLDILANLSKALRWIVMGDHSFLGPRLDSSNVQWT